MTALDQAILDNEKLVYFTVSKYYPAYLYDDDIIQIGRIGLWNALKTYKPEASEFGNYAVVCIKHEIDKHFQVQNYPMRKGKTVSLDAEHCNIDGEVCTLANLIGAVYIDTAPFDWEELRTFLTPVERQILAMHLQGYNQTEIGHVIGATKQAVSLRFIDIKNRLKIFAEGGVPVGKRHYRCRSRNRRGYPR